MTISPPSLDTILEVPIPTNLPAKIKWKGWSICKCCHRSITAIWHLIKRIGIAFKKFYCKVFNVQKPRKPISPKKIDSPKDDSPELSEISTISNASTEAPDETSPKTPEVKPVSRQNSQAGSPPKFDQLEGGMTGSGVSTMSTDDSVFVINKLDIPDIEAKIEMVEK